MAMTEEKIAAYCRDHGFARTGVFATAEEIEQARRWAAEKADAPVAKVHGRWLHEEADEVDEVLKRRIDSLAQAHGLSALPPNAAGDADHYGLLASGEFVTAQGSGGRS